MSEAPEVYRRHSGVRYRVVDGDAVVVKQQSAELMVLNEVGARILELLDGARSLEQIREVLETEFEVAPEALAADIESFLEELLEAGLVEKVSPKDLRA